MITLYYIPIDLCTLHFSDYSYLPQQFEKIGKKNLPILQESGTKENAKYDPHQIVCVKLSF